MNRSHSKPFWRRLTISLGFVVAALLIGVAGSIPGARADDTNPNVDFAPDLNYWTNNNIIFYDGDACDGCIALGNNQAIVRTALQLAWPNRGHGPERADATQAYQDALPQFNGSVGNQEYSDCGVFVATVMHMSGADPNYPSRYTRVQLPYLRSHPELYDVFEETPHPLVPGDIFIFKASPSGHTFIYTGPYRGTDTKKTYTIAAASLHGHVPQAGFVYFDQQTRDGVWHHFTVARLKRAIP